MLGEEEEISNDDSNGCIFWKKQTRDSNKMCKTNSGSDGNGNPEEFPTVSQSDLCSTNIQIELVVIDKISCEHRDLKKFVNSGNEEEKY